MVSFPGIVRLPCMSCLSYIKIMFIVYILSWLTFVCSALHRAWLFLLRNGRVFAQKYLVSCRVNILNRMAESEKVLCQSVLPD